MVVVVFQGSDTDLDTPPALSKVSRTFLTSLRTILTSM